MAIPAEVRARAERLLDLHRGPRLLVLPNAWDAASARAFAAHPRCVALATSSAGCAAVLGYPDGELVPRDDMLDLVARIVRAVDVPVPADLEAGYGDRPDDAAETAIAALAAGAVGMNLEDGRAHPHAASGPLVPVAAHAAKVGAVREAALRLGVPFVLNARVDAYIREAGEPAGRFEETVTRANAYLRAGADSIFVPAVTDAETIGRLAAAVDGPLNVLGAPTTPPVAELERLGVRRLTVGSGPHRATLAQTARMASALLDDGTLGFLADSLPFADAQRLLGAGPDRP
ncbi:MAG: isocitrate lyase/phosphoenolpyruvate mutase family protein [Thermoleophilia bacterium]